MQDLAQGVQRGGVFIYTHWWSCQIMQKWSCYFMGGGGVVDHIGEFFVTLKTVPASPPVPSSIRAHPTLDAVGRSRGRRLLTYLKRYTKNKYLSLVP